MAQGVPADQKVSIIGIEPIIDNAKYVHHFTIYGGKEPLENMTCPDMDPLLKEMTFVWAPGEPAFLLPDDVGGPVGPGGGLQSYILDIHYDNFALDEGQIDSSRVRFYYTLEPREYDYGILQLGDPTGKLFGDRLGGEGLAEFSFACPGSCSQTWMQDDGSVTVVREFLHMHRTGAAIRNEQIRNGEVVHTGRVDYFDFTQQGNQPVQQGTFEIQPGDAFQTTCHFNSQNTTEFGASSQAEMCISFLMYYPRIVPKTTLGWFCAPEFPVEDCASPYESKMVADVPRDFGQELLKCPKVPDLGTAGLSGSGRHSVYATSLLVGVVLFFVARL